MTPEEWESLSEAEQVALLDRVRAAAEPEAAIARASFWERLELAQEQEHRRHERMLADLYTQKGR